MMLPSVMCVSVSINKLEHVLAAIYSGIEGEEGRKEAVEVPSPPMITSADIKQILFKIHQLA